MKKFINTKIIPKVLLNQRLHPERPLPQSMRIDHSWSRILFEQLDQYFSAKQSTSYIIFNWLIVLTCMIRLGENIGFLVHNTSEHTRYVLNDWSLFVGGLQTYQLFVYCSAFFWITVLHYILYLPSNEGIMVWRELFDLCRGQVCPVQLGFTADDYYLIKQFLTRATLIFKLSSYSFYNLYSLIVLGYLAISIEFYTLKLFLISLPSGFHVLITCYYLCYDSHLASTFLYLIFHFLKLRISSLNQRLDQIHEHREDLNSKDIVRLSAKLIEEHNSICKQICDYNKFWRKYLFFMLLSLMPLSLFMLNQIIFKHMQMVFKLMNGFAVITAWLFIFVISYFASVVPKSMKKTAKKLFKVQMLLDQNKKKKNETASNGQLRSKLMAMSAFERVANRHIGFSVGPMFVMNDTTLSKIVIIYIRYLLLTTKFTEKFE